MRSARGIRACESSRISFAGKRAERGVGPLWLAVGSCCGELHDGSVVVGGLTRRADFGPGFATCLCDSSAGVRGCLLGRDGTCRGLGWRMVHGDEDYP